ncbi:hypothetical protein O9993_21475 [Vibrio lentus]|nr:hypothetical protein [Vibrio lentus]
MVPSDDNASVDDWGTEVDPYTREFSDGDLTVTVQSNDDQSLVRGMVIRTLVMVSVIPTVKATSGDEK